MGYDIESKIEQRFRKKIQAMGGRCFKWVSPGNDGVPDRIVVMPGGRIYFVELKRSNDSSLRKVQEYQTESLSRLGCDVTVAYGEEGIKLFLERIGSNEV